MSACLYLLLLSFVLFFYTENDEMGQESEGNIDQVAVVSTNILFFVILFVFAIFET